MRAVKSIILAAGVYKTEHPEQDEYILVLKAIIDCNLPKFITEDQPLFHGIINDLFPDTQQKETPYTADLVIALAQVMEDRSLTRVPEFELKAI